ncbi:rhomboid-related protein 2-like [Diabrotica undecimpunctata]|uniref:rhomboid-related protein 2-like n=1 Tax=Diabrotica undecimpunctata TaxID=50387 RepID=UPI003B638565
MVEEGNEDETVQLRTLTWRILNNPDLHEFFKSVFNRCDTNKDGLVSVNELRKFLEMQEEVEIPDDVLESIYTKFDKNKDRQLDFVEFLELFTNRTFKETFYNVANKILKFVVLPPKNRNTPHLQRTITFTGAYERQFRCRANILGMAVLSIIQLICFYANSTYKRPNVLSNALRFHPCKKRQVYRYFTYLLLHADNMHLYGNIVIQILIGVPLEMVHSWRVVVIYVAGAFGGCLTHSVLDRSSTLVGGSGGVFSFFTAHIAAVILNWREWTHPTVHVLVFGVVVVIDVFYKIFGHTEVGDETSYLSHAGGAVVGLLFGVNILRNIRETKLENDLWYICLVTLGALTITFIVLDFKLPMEIDCCNVNITMKSENLEFVNRTIFNS